jgi:hypothetical protein
MRSIKVVLLLAGLSMWLVPLAACQEKPIPAVVKDVQLLNEKEAVIIYEIHGDTLGEFSVEVFLEKENDPAFRQQLKSLKGDLKGRLAGRTCRITWNYAIDCPEARVEEGFTITIQGRRTDGGGRNDVVKEESGGGWPWYYYAGGAVVVGGAAVLIASGKSGSTTPVVPPATIPTPPDRP